MVHDIAVRWMREEQDAERLFCAPGYCNAAAEESATSGNLGEFFQELRPASGLVEEGGKEFEKVG